jgi:hypothetical protein
MAAYNGRQPCLSRPARSSVPTKSSERLADYDESSTASGWRPPAKVTLLDLRAVRYEQLFQDGTVAPVFVLAVAAHRKIGGM